MVLKKPMSYGSVGKTANSTVTLSSFKLTPVGGSGGYLFPLVYNCTCGKSLSWMCALHSEFYSELIAPMSGAYGK